MMLRSDLKKGGGLAQQAKYIALKTLSTIPIISSEEIPEILARCFW
jgi:hypothetical protein